MRSREFRNEDVLLKVMSVFWKHGFTATSIDDLTRETGVSRSGLYGEFKSKKGLFLEASRVYDQNVVGRIIGAIEGTPLGLAAIRQAFETIGAAALGDERLGCLICNVSSELSGQDQEIQAVVIRFQNRVRSVFLHCLKNAQRLGEIPSTVNLDSKADFLLASFQGLAHAVRSPMSKAAINNYIDGVFAAVGVA